MTSAVEGKVLAGVCRLAPLPCLFTAAIGAVVVANQRHFIPEGKQRISETAAGSSRVVRNNKNPQKDPCPDIKTRMNQAKKLSRTGNTVAAARYEALKAKYTEECKGERLFYGLHK